MCLDKLADFEIKKNYGWQYFDPQKTFGKLSELLQERVVQTDKWIKDDCEIQLRCMEARREYRTGFHMFLYKPYGKPFSAENGFIYATDLLRKVYFRDIVAKGYILKRKTIVARERYVCDKTKRPPKD